MTITADDQVVRAYVRGVPVGNKEQYILFLESELRRLENTVRQLTEAAIQVAIAEPNTPKRGMVRYAKTPWDPLGTAFEGLVVYDGTSWAAV